MLTSILLCLTCCLQTPDPSLRLRAEAAARDTLPLYTWLHAHPELSGHEVLTAAKLADALRHLGARVHEHMGGQGLVGVLPHPHGAPGPVVLLRADMDGLPVTEQTGLPYSSQQPGVMHACGHDIHMSTGVGALRLLQQNPHLWRGTVLLMAQPAEEIVTGARDMVADKRFLRLIADVGKPIAALAWHDAALPAGTVALRAGAISASVDSIDIVVHGVGGHGAQPQTTVDAVVMAADMVMALQTVVSRRIAPGDVAVLTIGQFEAGTKRNIIANKATLSLTVRSFSPQVRAKVISEIRRIVMHMAQAYGAPQPPEVVELPQHVDSVINDAPLNERLSRVFVQHLGAEHVLEAEASTGGEDFGAIPLALGVPGLLMRLGAVNPQLYANTAADKLPGLHSEAWAPDALPTLSTGIYATVLAVSELTR